MASGEHSVFRAFDSSVFLTTPASEKLNRLLDHSAGGIIGIAGGPGSGKSWTLLQAIFHARERDPISIAFAVSVRRDAEPFDFLLDLLGTVASVVAGPLPEARRWQRGRALEPVPGRPLASLARLWPAGVAAGIALIWASMSNAEIEATMVLGITCCVIGVLGALIVHGRVVSDFFRYRIVRGRRGSTQLQRRAIDLLHLISIEKEYELVSYTTGSSLALKALGLEAGVTGSATFTRRNRTLAELANECASFLHAVSEEAPLYVAIDDVEPGPNLPGILRALAQVAHVPRCHYMIALPDAGMPDYTSGETGARFIAVIRLQPLVIREALQLLAAGGRVSSLPFAALCSCLAGGVPRDLLRIGALGSTEVASIDSDLGLTALQLVRLEASRTTESTIYTLRALDTPQARRWLACALELNLGSFTARDLLAYCHRLDAAYEPAEDIHARDSAQEAVGRLAASYYQYATILDFFGPGSDTDSVQTAANVTSDDPRSFETLTSSQRLASVDPAIAWNKISRFRLSWGLEVLTAPHLLSAK